ncbi:histidine kinase [Hymenobacter gummosus]|uniref:Histidine kinase n=1 Tax=Hymenobacter gummosus TaxID=1776032 RepID=A0A431U8V2_9BACT|nr:histidine kinase [Hymenobacter gummosus]RTQ53325.1 histidine kinase [Hymenobacter gummosus]
MSASASPPLTTPAPWFRFAPAEPSTSRRVPLWAHLVLWALLLLSDGLEIWQQLTHDKPGAAGQYQAVLRTLGRGLLYDLLYAGVFYLNWRELIPRLLARGRVALYALGVVLLLTLFVSLRVGISMSFFPDAPGIRPRTMVQRIVPYSITGLMMVFLSSALKVTGDYLRGQRRRRELERQQLLTELALLKMQVNPHFLFNTLNNIYSLASQKSDRAPEAILRLAELMRYMLHDSAADTVPLPQELQHLHSFLELQRLRLPATGPAPIVFDTSALEAEAAPAIAPMLLLPLVENAFKHGDLTARPVVSIRLSQPADGSLHFVIDNAVADPAAGPALEQPGGVGLTNLRRRLQLLYPGRHRLDIDATPVRYRAALTLLPATPAQ